MQVSVVIPCYNAGRYLSTTLRSVLAQNGVDIEVIVVDDGSRDGSADLVERDFPQVFLLRQSNQGVAAARNAGISVSRHPWIAFVDADDLWLPGKLLAQRDALAARPNSRMAYTAWQVWRSDRPEPDATERQGFLESADLGHWDGPEGWIYTDLLLEAVVWTSTVVIHRSLLDEAGVFDPSLRIGEDLDLWLRASRLTPIVRVPRPLALYRLHGQNITHRPPERNFQGEVILSALARWGYGSPDGRQARRADVLRALARGWTDFAGSHLLAGNVARAHSAAWKAVRTDPSLVAGWKLVAKSLARSLRSAERCND